MIEAVFSLLRLLGGLGALFGLGYVLLALLLPQPREFRALERLALAFGAGVILLTLWMLALTWRGHPFSLALILGPLPVLSAALFLTPWGRRTLSADLRALRSPWRLTLTGWDWLFAGLLMVLLLYALPPGRPLSHVGLGRHRHLGLQGQGLLCHPGAGPHLHRCP